MYHKGTDMWLFCTYGFFITSQHREQADQGQKLPNYFYLSREGQDLIVLNQEIPPGKPRKCGGRGVWSPIFTNHSPKKKKGGGITLPLTQNFKWKSMTWSHFVTAEICTNTIHGQNKTIILQTLSTDSYQKRHYSTRIISQVLNDLRSPVSTNTQRSAMDFFW